MAVDVSVDRTYAVDTQDVFLSLTIGEGQFGVSDVRLGSQTLVRASGPINVRVGKGTDIAGQTLVVTSVINDVNTHTNRMSVSYRLTGGKAPAAFVGSGDCPSEGGVLVFQANISLQ